ncbi:MAG: spermidine/putrescine ABC transporter substrate-binding protein [Phycisphaeraceae bacterium]|nr:spermidine/putrescine ABC transporter substrate-binding protein [Phycisphaeraceae bacterium]
MHAKHLTLIVAAAFVALSVGLWAGPAAVKAKDKPVEINVYMWSEYIDPAITEEFEKETGIKVNLSYYESTEEMKAKLQHAAGVSQYDVVVADTPSVPMLIRLGLVQALDHGKIENLKNLDPRFRNAAYDPDNKYTVVYQWGTVGLIYNKEKLPNLPATWGVLFDPAKQAGTFLMIDEMRDQMGVALRYLGQSVNCVDVEQVRKAGELILTAKKSKNAQGFEGGVGGKNRVAAGSVEMAVVWNGDALRAIEEDEDQKLAFFVPEEGSIIWADVMVIPSQAPHAEAAHRFINYLLKPEVGAQLSNFNKYATPNAAAMPFITPEDRENPVIYPPQEIMDKLEYLQDLGNSTRIYDEVWTAVKSR